MSREHTEVTRMTAVIHGDQDDQNHQNEVTLSL